MFSRKAAGDGVPAGHAPTERQQTGQSGEDRALALLQGRGLKLLARNYRVAGGPSARGGEVDLILRDRDGTLVFVEVRVPAGSTWWPSMPASSAGCRRPLMRVEFQQAKPRAADRL